MKAPEYLAINPMGKVPALRHGDTIVTEAAAICAYLADVFPGGRPCAAAGLAPARTVLSLAVLRRRTDRSGQHQQGAQVVVPAERTRMVGYGTQERALAALEDQLNRSEYIAGDRFTAADVYVGSHIGSGMTFGVIDKRPAFERYWALVGSRPAAQRAARDRSTSSRRSAARPAESEYDAQAKRSDACD